MTLGLSSKVLKTPFSIFYNSGTNSESGGKSGKRSEPSESSQGFFKVGNW